MQVDFHNSIQKITSDWYIKIRYVLYKLSESKTDFFDIIDLFKTILAHYYQEKILIENLKTKFYVCKRGKGKSYCVREILSNFKNITPSPIIAPFDDQKIKYDIFLKFDIFLK